MAGVLTLFGLIGACVDYSYHWQYGNAVREVVPIPVALVEVSCIGMKGYVGSVRSSMMMRIIAVRWFVLEPELVERREKIEEIEREWEALGENIYTDDLEEHTEEM